ncbi:MAG: precorrin-6A reductase [Clostridia bacterium]
MILVFAGTQDGRELAALLAARGYKTVVSVVSDYGAELVQPMQEIQVVKGKLQKSEMIKLFQDMDITTVLDATHPFARNVSENAIHACKEAGIYYLRYERPTEDYAGYDNVIAVESVKHAVDMLNKMEGRVLLTTGSNSLDIVTKGINEKDRIVARVLPGLEIMSKCIQLGLQPKQIIAMQGPFSRELNREMFKHCNAQIVLTKDSGSVGGTQSKILAAQDSGIPIIVITRPQVEYPLWAETFEKVLERLREWEN